MSIDRYFFIIGILFLIIFFCKKKRKSKIGYTLLFLGVFFLFAPSFLPGYLFGKIDAIKYVKDNEISSVILQPSQPEYSFNLVDSTVKIENRNRIEYLLNLLHNTEIYSPNHNLGIWEVNLILVNTVRDSFTFRIEKLENDETVIYSKDGNYKKKGVGEYLETIVGFKHPVKGK